MEQEGEGRMMKEEKKRWWVFKSKLYQKSSVSAKTIKKKKLFVLSLLSSSLNHLLSRLKDISYGFFLYIFSRYKHI